MGEFSRHLPGPAAEVEKASPRGNARQKQPGNERPRATAEILGDTAVIDRRKWIIRIARLIDYSHDVMEMSKAKTEVGEEISPSPIHQAIPAAFRKRGRSRLSSRRR
jgi:hypothetical protein